MLIHNSTRSLKLKISYFSFLIFVTLVCNFLILYGNATRSKVFTSIGTRILIPIVVLYGFFLILTNYKTRNIVLRLFFALFFATFFAVALSADIKILEHFIPYMQFMMLPIYLTYFVLKYDEIGACKSLVYVANTVYIAFFIYLYFSKYAFLFNSGYGDTNIDELTLGFDNPNETAMYLMISFFVAFSAIFYYQKKFIKIFYSILSAILIYLIYLTNSRVALILVIVCIILKFSKVLRYSNCKEQIYIILFPILFALLLVAFPKFFGTHEFLGSSWSTDRDSIYLSALSKMNFFNVLFGDFLGYGGSNLHNSYLSVFVSFGIINFAIYLLFIIACVKSFSKVIDKPYENVGYIALLCLILHGSVEAALFISGTVYAGMFSMVLVLLGNDKNQAKELHMIKNEISNNHFENIIEENDIEEINITENAVIQ